MKVSPGFSQQHCSISLCTRVWLHVSILGTEQFANAVDGQLLNLVHYLATAIVAMTGITLGILVGQIAAHSFHYLIADEILRSNQFDTFQLTLMLFLNELKNGVVSFHYYLVLYV